MTIHIVPQPHHAAFIDTSIADCLWLEQRILEYHDNAQNPEAPRAAQIVNDPAYKSARLAFSDDLKNRAAAERPHLMPFINRSQGFISLITLGEQFDGIRQWRADGHGELYETALRYVAHEIIDLNDHITTRTSGQPATGHYNTRRHPVYIFTSAAYQLTHAAVTHDITLDQFRDTLPDYFKPLPILDALMERVRKAGTQNTAPSLLQKIGEPAA